MEPLPPLDTVLRALRERGIELRRVPCGSTGSATRRRWAHKNFFTRECTRIGRSFDETMPVVCESFELLRTLPL